MLRRFAAVPALAALAALLLAFPSPARAGQVRVLAGSGGFTFTPSTVTINAGDHVVWQWASNGHTVTSGTDGSPAGDGAFRSSTSGTASTTRFSWKFATSGSRSYYCVPHFPDMTGVVNVVPSGAAVANFRITEVEYAGAAGADRVQISNLGTAAGFLDSFRMCWVTGTPQAITGTNVSVAAGAAINLHFNASGTNTATDLYFPALPELPTQGSFALYVPNTTSTGSTSPASLADATQIIDYVEWGSPGQAAKPNQATAVSAGFWAASDAVNTDGQLPAGGAGYSISFCGAPTDHGASAWQISRPNFGTSARCATPTRNPTWGRIKALYR